MDRQGYFYITLFCPFLIAYNSGFVVNFVAAIQTKRDKIIFETGKKVPFVMGIKTRLLL
jgi:hypothetical protein